MGNYTIGNYVQKILTGTAHFLKNCAYIAVAGATAGGVILGFGVDRTTPSNKALLNDAHVAQIFTAVENSSGCVDAGTASGCVQIVSGVTRSHDIFTKTGGLIIGSFASPKIHASGAYMKIGGGYVDKDATLEIIGTGSGRKLHAQDRLTSSGALSVDGKITADAVDDIGWTIVTGTNTACNTTCTSACVGGFDAGATNNAMLACTDAAAESCLCAGAN